MSWEKYLGLPFADHSQGGLDCWGLVRHILAEECGLVLPTYGEGYRSTADIRGVTKSIKKGLAESFQETDDPRMFDLVIFKKGNIPLHVGLVIGPTQFIHSNPPDERGIGGVTRIERFTDALWAPKVVGFYRYVG